jgi:hypothetical protein
LSVSELEENVTRPLAKDYYVNPQVLISVRDYKSKKVYLTGAVQKSGLFPLDSSTTTVLELIAKAGGVSKDRSNYAYILRGSIAELSAEKGISELIQQKNSIKVNLRGRSYCPGWLHSGWRIRQIRSAQPQHDHSQGTGRNPGDHQDKSEQGEKRRRKRRPFEARRPHLRAGIMALKKGSKGSRGSSSSTSSTL